MSSQAILLDTPNATSSPESEAGATLSNSQAGQMIDPSGREVARANLTPRQAKGRGLLTSGTYGQAGSISSESASLAQSLASRLQRLLTTAGSTLFKMTWKESATPSQHMVWLPVISGHRTKENDCISWPTARQTDGEKNVRSLEGSLKEIERKGGPQDLCQAAQLSSWPTPSVQDDNQSRMSPEAMERERLRPNKGSNLASVAFTAGWYSPRARGDAGGNRWQAGDVRNLEDQAQMSSWLASTTRDFRDGSSSGTVPINGLLGRQVWLTADGPTPYGSGAEMENIGRLNPAHSRWLMGFPPEWDACAVTVTLSSRKSRQPSSKRTSKVRKTDNLPVDFLADL
jgi:hypothetical protein